MTDAAESTTLVLGSPTAGHISRDARVALPLTQPSSARRAGIYGKTLG
jgi:hypothetical protein